MTDIQLENFSRRFVELIRHYGHNPGSFATSLGHNRSDNVRNFASGRGYPTSKLLIEIAEHFEVNWNWFMTGNGDINANQAEVLGDHNIDNSKMVMESMQREIEAQKERIKEQKETIRELREDKVFLKEQFNNLKGGFPSPKSGT
tara:strand:- start:4113 stop:4547 length:435 start_codon:yes stop_codon:yes gene_type:complete